MNQPGVNAQGEMMNGLELAILFHETYERLAPSFGYETRPDTKAFDPESKNGRLMVATCTEIQKSAAAPAASGDELVARLRDRSFASFGNDNKLKEEAADALAAALCAPVTRSEIIEECAKAAESEHLVDPTNSPDDEAYDLAVNDCAKRIRSLK